MIGSKTDVVSAVIVVLNIANWILQGTQRPVEVPKTLRCDEKPVVKFVVPEGCYIKRLPPV